MTKNINFIDFLNNEFCGKKTKKVILKSSTSSKIASKGCVKEIKNPLIKKSSNNIKSRLSNASKLIKVMEVFLDDEKDKTTADSKIIEEWMGTYDDTKFSINKDVELLLRARNKDVKKRAIFLMFNKKIEYPSENVLNYSVVVAFLIALSFFLATVFPGFTNKSIALIDSLFINSDSRATQIQNISAENNFIDSKKTPAVINKDQLAEYIKNNSNNLKGTSNIPIEDIVGDVAGIEE